MKRNASFFITLSFRIAMFISIIIPLAVVGILSCIATFLTAPQGGRKDKTKEVFNEMLSIIIMLMKYEYKEEKE